MRKHALVAAMGLAACGKSAEPTSGVSAREEYVLKSKAAEAELNLKRMAKEAKVFFAEQAAFPVGTVALTPAVKCCAAADHKCPLTDEWQTTPVWQQLFFDVISSSYFQYSYTGTATDFTATAVGDLDCDGTAITYTLTGKSPGGTPSVELKTPDPLD